jgi:hypothetical protein
MMDFRFIVSLFVLVDVVQTNNLINQRSIEKLTLIIVLFFFQTFHTPSFGDEEFDIPELHHPTAQPQHHQIEQYHHHMGMMSEQQTVPAVAAYGQHQWHHQQPTADMMANQTYQLQSPNHSNYHQMSSPNQQMLLMQPNAMASPTQNQQHIQQHQTQISPQLGSTYIGQSPPQTAGSDENEDSDDNVLNDPNVSFFFR